MVGGEAVRMRSGVMHEECNEVVMSDRRGERSATEATLSKRELASPSEELICRLSVADQDEVEVGVDKEW